MGALPPLKTSAVTQYSLWREQRHPVRVLRYAGGREQRFAAQRMLLAWRMRLELLDEGEVEAMERFFQQHLGSGFAFAFEDPLNGVNYNCRLEEGSLQVVWLGEGQARLEFTVVEEA